MANAPFDSLNGININDSLIQRLINQLSYKSRIHICIHYSSGEFQKNKIFEINPDNMIHRNPFCDEAKTTSCGLRRCLKNKGCSIKKVRFGNIYAGKCYLGTTEIALSSGFNSCSYFDTIFKKYMSLTPFQFRSRV